MRRETEMRLWVSELHAGSELSERDVAALIAVPIIMQDMEPGQDIFIQGDAASQVCLIFEGLVCSYELVGDGLRQIQAYHLAGDLPDLGALHFGTSACSMSALRASRVGFISHFRLRKLFADHPIFAASLWRKSMVDASIANAWITNLGRRSAYGRVAHLVCELLSRSRALARADDTLPFWLTQNEIADAQGLSVVHVNRVMTTLKKHGLIRMDGRRINVLDWNGLTEAGGFDPAYLHQRQAKRFNTGSHDSP